MASAHSRVNSNAKRTARRVTLAFICSIGKFTEDGAEQQRLCDAHRPARSHSSRQELLRSSVHPKYSCQCIEKSMRHARNRQHRGVSCNSGASTFEKIVIQCTQRVRTAFQRIDGFEYAGMLASSDGRGLSVSVVQCFLAKLMSNAGPNDQVLVWYIGHGADGTGNWFVGEHPPPGFAVSAAAVDKSSITRRHILKLYRRFFTGGRLTIVSDCCHAGEWTRDKADQLPTGVEFGARPVAYSSKTHRGRLAIVAACAANENIPLNKLFYDAVFKALEQAAQQPDLHLTFAYALSFRGFTRPLPRFDHNHRLYDVQFGLQPEMAYFWAKIPDRPNPVVLCASQPGGVACLPHDRRCNPGHMHPPTQHGQHVQHRRRHSPSRGVR